MEVFALLWCIGWIGNSLGLPRPQEPLPTDSVSRNKIVSIPEKDPCSDEDNLNPSTDFSLESNILQEVTNRIYSGKSQPQLKSENTEEVKNISENGLMDTVENITTELGTLMKNESQIIVADFKETAGNITKNLELLASDFVMELILQNLRGTKDTLTKIISNGLTSAISSESGKQIAEEIKAISDRVSSELGKLSSDIQKQLMKTIGFESMIGILTKTMEIETTVSNMENDVENILEKTHIKDHISNVMEAFIGKDAVDKIETVVRDVIDGASGAVKKVMKIVNDVNEDGNE